MRTLCGPVRDRRGRVTAVELAAMREAHRLRCLHCGAATREVDSAVAVEHAAPGAVVLLCGSCGYWIVDRGDLRVARRFTVSVRGGRA